MKNNKIRNSGKNKKSTDPAVYSQFKNMVKFEPEEFHRAFELAMKATTDKSAELDPTGKTFYAEEEEGGPVKEYVFTDHPIARSTAAMIKLYSAEPEKYFSVNARLHALLSMAADEILDKWCFKIDGGMFNIHHAVIDAAAQAPLSDEGTFLEKEFIEMVEKIIVENYPDLESDAIN